MQFGTTANSACNCCLGRVFPGALFKNGSNNLCHYHGSLKLLIIWTKRSPMARESNSLKKLIHKARVVGKDLAICPLFALNKRRLTEDFTGPELTFQLLNSLKSCLKKGVVFKREVSTRSRFPLSTFPALSSANLISHMKNSHIKKITNEISALNWGVLLAFFFP